MINNALIKKFPKKLTAISIAVLLGCFGAGDRKSVGAQTMVEVRPIFIQGPILPLPEHLEFSLDRWFEEQGKSWETRSSEMLSQQTQTSRNTNGSAAASNPLPLLSFFLEDTYRILQAS